jgi:predicted metalloprotease
MRWQDREESTNVEDRRGISGGQVAAGGGIGVLVIALLMWVSGADPGQILQMVSQSQAGSSGPAAPGAPPSPEQEKEKKFVSVVLADTEKVWGEEFQKMGRRYELPQLVLFAGRTRSGCGAASTASGPFYCPEDRKVYLDLDFFRELSDRFRAPGEFARAYVIAHEVGHHVQKLLGITDKVDAARERLSEVEYNRLSVRLELQADFLAGLWARHADQNWKILEPGDVETALNAATAIGDDRLQRQAEGTVNPDTFTHGTSAQRVRWFRKGLQTGDINQGDTFSLSDGQL